MGYSVCGVMTGMGTIANIHLQFIKNLNEEKFDIFGHKSVTYHRGQAATFAP